jgi:hypothetical protein
MRASLFGKVCAMEPWRRWAAYRGFLLACIITQLVILYHPLRGRIHDKPSGLRTQGGGYGIQTA